jgi:hypothetical protein
MNRPLLLIDIDGVISLFGFDHRRPPPGRFVTVDGVVHFLSTDAAEQLLTLRGDFDLAWCSGWEEKADEHLPLALGLPAGFPHLTFGDGYADHVRHWKLSAIDAFAGAHRPVAWVDDAHDDSCQAWATERPAPTLLITTDPASGLTAAHTATLSAWARRLVA